jgi:tetratricopeptide (TPR) repeat protein
VPPMPAPPPDDVDRAGPSRVPVAIAPDWRQAAVLAAVTFAVFAPTLSSQFVYDARLQILTDTFLHDPRNWLDVLSFRVLARDVLDFNRPVQLASLMLDAAIWGRDSFGYHLTSVLLHCGNVVLLWLVIRDVLARGTGAGGGSATTAAVVGAMSFAVHPVVVEAVCEPTFREDLLVAAFTLAAIVIAGGIRDPGELARPFACAACCLGAVASKESGIATPLVLAVSWWLRHRSAPRRPWLPAVGGGAAVVVVFLAARFLLEPSPSVIFEQRPEYPGGSFARAVGIAPRILALYAQIIACPVNLCADYGLYSVAHLPLPLAIAILAGLAASLGRAAWADRRIAFGVALMLLPLVPVSNLVPIYRAAADRYLYVPLAGVATVVACLLDAPWLRGFARRRHGAVVAALAGLVVLGLACVERQRVWSSQLALWHDTARRNPASFAAAHGLAAALHEAGRCGEAEIPARMALRLSGSSRGEPWVTLALVLDCQGRTAEADEAVGEALELDPRLADPAGRVAVLALERTEAEALARLLRRRDRPSPPP